MRCGVDEAGRGPLAGAVYAAAVILGETGRSIVGLDDSKKMKAASREALAVEIKKKSHAWSIVAVDSTTIDRVNILQATLSAMHDAVIKLTGSESVGEIVIDGTHLPKALKAWASKHNVSLRALPKADATVAEVSAASILAKTARDAYMLEMDAIYPQYGFAQHKGYGTAQHMEAIRLYGPCALHRKSFAPISQYSLL
jgi:ribonuclease HII